jgi:hypothetical protein
MPRHCIALLIIMMAAAGAGATARAATGVLATMLEQARALPTEDVYDGMPQARLYDETTLTRAALKACLVAAWKLDEGEKRIEVERERLAKVRAELELSQTRLQAAAKANNGVPRAADKGLVDELRERRTAYLAAYNEFEADVEGRNAVVTSFNRDCAGKRYHGADLAAVRGELPFDLAPFEKR